MVEFTLHLLEKSRGHRILWLLKELKIEPIIKYYRRDPTTGAAPPELRHVQFLGKSPVLQIDKAVLAESAYICEYMVAEFGRHTELLPKTDRERWLVRECLYHCEGSFTPLFIMQFVNDKLGQSELNGKYADPNFKLQLEYIDRRLAANGTGYFVGKHLTAADIIYSFPILGSLGRFNRTEYPHIDKWINLISQRSAFISAKQLDSELEAGANAHVAQGGTIKAEPVGAGVATGAPAAGVGAGAGTSGPGVGAGTTTGVGGPVETARPVDAAAATVAGAEHVPVAAEEAEGVVEQAAQT